MFVVEFVLILWLPLITFVEWLLLPKEFSVPVIEVLAGGLMLLEDDILGVNPKEDVGEGDLDRRDWLEVTEGGARHVEPNRRFRLLLLLWKEFEKLFEDTFCWRWTEGATSPGPGILEGSFFRGSLEDDIMTVSLAFKMTMMNLLSSSQWQHRGIVMMMSLEQFCCQKIRLLSNKMHFYWKRQQTWTTANWTLNEKTGKKHSLIL